MIKITNFDEGVLILYGCFSKSMSFSKCATFELLQYGESYSKKFLPTPIVTFDIKRSNSFKMVLPQKNGSRIKTPSSKSLILMSFC